mmetsp:Transcript_21039/g.59746  ORF Transcript_21039/g.59746 Transcript_21039/m.59746 type:complete len:1090 (-) Transcript_21039:542-3811(-)
MSGICGGGAGADPLLAAAAIQWANQSQCECISMDDDSQFARLWGLCILAAILFCTAVTAPFCPRRWYRRLRKCCCRRCEGTGEEAPPEGEEREGEKDGGGETGGAVADEEAQEKPCVESASWWDDPTEGVEDHPEPDITAAERHLVSSSATKSGQWRSIWETSAGDLGEIGGPGTALYFVLLRCLGIVFAYMTALSCASVAFNALSSFAPDTGNFLSKTTIGNIGSSVSGAELPPEQRYIILKDEAGECQGSQVSLVTAIIGWLDFSATVIFLVAVLMFRFVLIPRIAEQTDADEITPADYAVEIENLPRRFEGMEEFVDADGRTAYERELSELICQRVMAVREKERLRAGASAEPADAGAPVKVEEMVLVRDFDERLGALKATAEWRKEQKIAEYCGEEKAAARLEKRIKKTSEKLDKKLRPEHELDVVRAYVILSNSRDAKRLVTDFRFSTYGLLRHFSQCVSKFAHLERCCPQRHRIFRGKAIQVTRAPEPSNIIWDNQDVPSWERHMRQGFICIVFLTIVIISFVLVYVANVGAKKSTMSSNQLLGSEECDPDLSRIATSDGTEVYRCLVQNATNWTRDFLTQNASGIEKACYCGSVGYGTIVQDPFLLNYVCKDWLLAIGTGIGLGVLATSIVVVINVVCKTVLLALAEQEKPLSFSALNAAKMVKIFALQTLNTGFVIFCVNFSPPAGVPFGDIIFLGEFKDSVRGWYTVVGAAILSNMLANAITPAATNIGMMVTAKAMRFCCKSRKKHQARLLKLYTNPDFDMAARFAQLLNTIFVTLTYSSGLPMLNLFACLYMLFTYWADKIILLRASSRPPAYDTQIVHEAVSIMIYSVPLHCIFAIWMFGQPCTFPSNPLGGQLANLAAQGSAASSNTATPDGLAERLSKESTWMITALLVLLVALYLVWTVLWILGGTLGELFNILILFACPKRMKVAPAPDESDSLFWKDAKERIERECPPASYKMTRHPAFKQVGKYMLEGKSFRATRNSFRSSRTGLSNGDDSPAKKPPVPEEVALGFLKALRAEFIQEEEGAVAKYLDDRGLSEEEREQLATCEEFVKKGGASEREAAIKDVAAKWGMTCPS